MSLSSWVLSIAVICILSVLIDLFLPQGVMSEHVKTVFNFIIILVFIMPIPNLFESQKDSLTFFNTTTIEIQEDFIYQLNRDKLTMLENKIEDTLEKNKILNIDISLSANIFEVQMQIEAVYVDLSNLVIENNEQHINIKNEVVKVISSFIEINKEGIIFSE